MTLLQAANQALDNWMESSKSSRLLKIDITAVMVHTKTNMLAGNRHCFLCSLWARVQPTL